MRTIPHHVGSLLGHAPAAEPGVDVGTAWNLFAVITVLLALFVFVVATIAVLRRGRRRAARSAASGAAPSPEVDAWSEAGRRAKSWKDQDDR